MIEISGKFLKPVYINDTLYPELEIIDLLPQKTTGIIDMRALINNQNKDLVLKAYKNTLLKENLINTAHTLINKNKFC